MKRTKFTSIQKSKQTNLKYTQALPIANQYRLNNMSVCVCLCALRAHFRTFGKIWKISVTNFCHIYFYCTSQMPCICVVVNTTKRLQLFTISIVYRSVSVYVQLTIVSIRELFVFATFNVLALFSIFIRIFILHSSVSIWYCSLLVSGLRIYVRMYVQYACWKDDEKKNLFNEWWPNITDNLLSPVNANENVRVIEFQPHSHKCRHV